VHRQAPATGLAGKFSFQYTAAIALLDGTVTVRSFSDERRFAPDTCDLLDRIGIEVDPDRQGRFDEMRIDMEVQLEDGRVVHGRCDGPPGIWGRPAGSERLMAKARDCLNAVLPSEQAERIVEATARFDELDPGAVLSLLDALSQANGRKD
jgi:2-methylcitrate dehydratase PrpD